MKDKLLYLTIGVLTGIVVMQWTMPSLTGFQGPIASQVSAHEIYPSADIAAFWGGSVLDRLGQVWSIGPAGWDRQPAIDPPVPITEIRHWGPHALLTKTGEIWVIVGENQWQNLGPWPGGDVPSTQETWGSVKGKYEGEE